MPDARSGAPDLLEREDGATTAAVTFEDVCRSHHARVRGLCRKLLCSDADADDAVQEAMLRAYKAWPQFRVGDDPWPWLATIAANVCRDAGRRQNRAAAHAAALDPEEPSSPDCYDVAARNVRGALVQEALASLPKAYGTPLYLRDIEGWSVTDIARLRGRSVASVRSSLTRSRRILATRIEELARDRHQWPLPAAASLVGAGRHRLARWKATVEGAAARGALPFDSMSTLASIRLTGVLQGAAALVTVAALSVATGEVAGSTGLTAPAPVPSGSAASSDTAADAAVAPVAPPRAAERSTPAAPAPAPAPGAPVEVRGARVNDAGVTETPTASAAPPAGAPVADGAGVLVFVGPARVDCASPGASESWDSSCSVLAAALEVSLGLGADED